MNRAIYWTAAFGGAAFSVYAMFATFGWWTLAIWAVLALATFFTSPF